MHKIAKAHKVHNDLVDVDTFFILKYFLCVYIICTTYCTFVKLNRKIRRKDD